MNVWLGIFWVAFLLPFNFFPFPDLPNDVLAMLTACVAFVVVAFEFRQKQVAIPRFVLFLTALIASVIVAGSSVTEFSYSDYAYSLFLLTAILVSISVGQLATNHNPGVLVMKLAKALLLISVITASYGILRYYGALKVWIPWIGSDGERLLGPLNQANLTALVLMLGVCSTAFLFIRRRISFVIALGVCLFLAIAASLSGSRAFLAFLVVVVVLPVIKALLATIGKESRVKRMGEDWRRALFIIAAVFFVVVSYPKIDAPISGYLIQEGIVERTTDQTITGRLGRNDNYRVSEWIKLKYANEVVDNTWLGIGAGQYSHFSLEADSLMDSPSRIGTLWVHGHNILINSFIELGLLGTGLVLALLVYLVFLFIKSSFSPENVFVFSALSVLFLNNMIEFSFWYFGFLALAVSLVSVVDRSFVFSFSSSSIMPLLAILVLLVSFMTTYYVGRDYYYSVLGFYAEDMSEGEHRDFLAAKNNRFVGADAMKAQIIRSEPSLYGVERQIQELEQLISWRPEMVFQMRMVSLLAASGNEQLACEKAYRVAVLFPKSVQRLVEELSHLKSIGAGFDLNRVERCIGEGMMYWVRKGLPEEAENSQTGE